MLKCSYDRVGDADTTPQPETYPETRKDFLMRLNTPLFLAVMLLACCSLVALSYWTPTAQGPDP